MPSSAKMPLVSVEEYLRLGRAVWDKSEYFRGEIYAMPDCDPRHSLVSANVSGELSTRLQGPCGRVDSCDLQTGRCTYRDELG